MIQQAVLQILQPFFDPTFSNDSYGFRPKRSAHQAIQRAQEHILAGYDWVVDLDLERFFDRVNHDVLMARVARRVKDKQMVRPLGPQISGVHRHDESEVASRPAVAAATPGSYSRPVSSGSGLAPGPADRNVTPDHPWQDRLLPTQRGEGRLRAPG